MIVQETRHILGAWIEPTPLEERDAWEHFFPNLKRRDRVSLAITHKATPDYKFTILTFTYRRNAK